MSIKAALIPYWLLDDPSKLDNSDHRWWFTPLDGYDTLIFIGPFLKTEFKRLSNKKIITIKTNSFIYELDSDFWNLLQTINISTNDIYLYWHVMEASSTCRVYGLNQLKCNKVAVVGDTHHMNNPISSLLDYLSQENFTHVCCSHNQYNPFFAAPLNLQSLDFPFCFPTNFHKQEVRKANAKIDFGQAINYYGTTLSAHHLHRSLIVNHLMKARENIIIHGRTSFTSWMEKISNPQIVLTCSLNGTFSFQQFLPMLYKCLVFTDPLSKANWLGEHLKNQKNIFVFEKRSDVKNAHNFIMNNDLDLDKLADYAQVAAAKGLREQNIFKLGNVIDILGDRIQLTEGECNLFNSIQSYILVHSFEKFLTILHTYEYLQELHRCNWGISVLAPDRSSDDHRLLFSMLSILPRISFLKEINLKHAKKELKMLKISNEEEIYIKLTPRLGH